MGASGLVHLVVAAGISGAAWMPTGTTGAAVVRGVFFFSPTCPHCHTVMNRDLPPLEARWGEALDLVYIDVTTETGARLYRAAVERFAIPRSRLGVPAVILGNRHLVGSVEIPAELPGLVEGAAARDGTPWPDIPGLSDALAELRADAEPASPAPDPVGMALGGGVFLALVGALGYGARALRRSRGTARPARTRPRSRRPPRADAIAATLAAAGLGIAGYLAWVAVSGGEAVCGPLGSCGAVHASRFSEVAGIPVAFLGVAFFASVLALALRPGRTGSGNPLAVVCWAGALFSLYLTGAEIFVIGAVCSWCLASALISAALLVRVSRPAVPAPGSAVPPRAPSPVA